MSDTAIEALRYSEFPNSSDCISRQAAIDALDGEITVTGRANAEAVRGYARLVADRLKRLPSAQPERKRGRWEVASTGYSGFMRCSVCKTGCCGDYRSMNFCPNCGAEMREVTE